MLTLEKIDCILDEHHRRLDALEALAKKQEPAATDHDSQSLAAFEAWVKKEGQDD